MKVAKARSLYLGSFIEEDLVEWSIYTQRAMGRTTKDFDERIKWPQKFDSEIHPGIRALQHSPHSSKVAHLEQLEASLLESTNKKLKSANRVRRIRTTFTGRTFEDTRLPEGPGMHRRAISDYAVAAGNEPFGILADRNETFTQRLETPFRPSIMHLRL